jgi:transposase
MLKAIAAGQAASSNSCCGNGAVTILHAVRQKLSQPKVTVHSIGLLRLVRTATLAHSKQERSGQGLPLWRLNRQEAFSLFRTDGRVATDNNPVERALRLIGIGRKNWFFAGANTSAETLA